MSGPWEKYQEAPSAETEGPWTKYSVRGPSPVSGQVSTPPPSMLEQLGGGALHALQRASAGVSGAGKFLLGPLAAPFEMANEYATSKGYPLTPTEQQLTQGAEFVKNTGPASTIGSIGADIALSAIPVSVGGRALTQVLAKLGRFAPAVGDVAANAGYAAATSPENRGTAAMLGGGGAAVGRAVGRVFKPTTPSADAQRLIDAGVQPTYGQVMGSKGSYLGRAIARLEEAGQSLPLAGPQVGKLRENALEQFAQATRRDALPPGAPVEMAKSLDTLGDAFKSAYTKTLDDLTFRAAPPNTTNVFDAFTEELPDTVGRVAYVRPVTEADVARAEALVSNVFDIAENSGTPKSAHWIESRLKELAWKQKTSLDPNKREYGELLHDIANAWGQQWRGQLTGTGADEIRALDNQFAKFIPLRRAGATGSLADPDTYTPKQLLRAIRAGDKTPNKGQFQAGTLPQQQLASAADKVLGSKIPDTGTASRLMTGAVLGTGAAVTGMGVPAILTAGAALGYSTPMVQKWLTGQLPIPPDVVHYATLLGSQTGRSLATQP